MLIDRGRLGREVHDALNLLWRATGKLDSIEGIDALDDLLDLSAARAARLTMQDVMVNPEAGE